MKAIRRLMNTPKIPPCQNIRGMVQTMNEDQIEHLSEKSENGAFVAEKKFKEPLPLIFLDKGNVSSECSIFRFMLPDIDKPLGFLPGQHVTLQGDTPELEGKYSPISPAGENGLIDCLVKVYSRQFQNKDKCMFTEYLDKLKEGDKVKLTSVGGSFTYQGRGFFNLIDSETGALKSKAASKIGLISSGIGITPMYQIIQAVEEDPIDLSALSLLSFYEAPLDALLEDDLNRLEQTGILSYFPVVESPDEMWVHGEGSISKEYIENFMPHPEDPESFILVSGKPTLVEQCKTLLSEMGYSKEQYHIV